MRACGISLNTMSSSFIHASTNGKDSLLNIFKRTRIEEFIDPKHKEMVNVEGDRNGNYPDLSFTHCIYVLSYHTTLYNINRYNYYVSNKNSFKNSQFPCVLRISFLSIFQTSMGNSIFSLFPSPPMCPFLLGYR